MCGMWARDVNTSFIGLNGCTVCRWLNIFLNAEIKYIFYVWSHRACNYGRVQINKFFLMHLNSLYICFLNRGNGSFIALMYVLYIFIKCIWKRVVKLK